ncbi:sugar phosphate isomerase/epimerase and 4-hydroxyphenylpyruvate domain-containing protein [Quadrisphaera setariae]|uniref:3-dehydroshikimate dehydratase n=1 Tax=Quadrisphaera setariae TaxID=2593304 RepID=A0A5C8ZHN6_9ACTN|nr:sugar phosphate isomerase/epimerase and 4-hydroxyphenylpyruvate domain-containing protein [Quadrisphaera setariae]TXR56436.1 sugar phosphate isomerase/epimerase and 4-hydroxyphenylpyruvate domain-containing protein [Quadrisphaera setariae]
MHQGIATVSLSGRLVDKLPAIAAAGFDGLELFDNDLVASALTPREVAARCADLGLGIDLFQPVRDVEGVAPDRFGAVEHRFRVKLGVMAELGATTVLCCSNALPDAVDDVDLSAEQLHRLGDLAAEAGVVIAYEALAWGRHVHRVGQAWEVVRRADHPAVTLAVDTFHLLSRGDGPQALAGVPGDRIGFLQVADAPVLEMGLLEWSRHHRCFPGQGALDVAGVVAAVLEAGYRGPLSLEVFSDLVREAAPAVTARDAKRSLVFLEDQLATRLPAGSPAREVVTASPPAAARVDPAFVELAASPGADVERLLEALGFVAAGRHRSRPVALWRNGGAHVVVSEAPAEAMATGGATALGVVAPPVADVAARAAALLWPAVDVVRSRGEAVLPGLATPSGLHVLLSAEPGQADHWRGDFAALPPGATGGLEAGGAAGAGWVGLDHVAVAVPPDLLAQEVSFHRTLLGLEPGPVEEFVEPHGRLRSRALRPASGGLRLVLNAPETAAGAPRRRGVTQLAYAVTDVRAEAVRLREAGVPLMPVPDNYYVDLGARFSLPDEALADLRAHGLLYDRDTDGGELVHLYTAVLSTGFHVELLERRGGYAGYGGASTHVRLAAQA